MLHAILSGYVSLHYSLTPKKQRGARATKVPPPEGFEEYPTSDGIRIHCKGFRQNPVTGVDEVCDYDVKKKLDREWLMILRYKNIRQENIIGYQDRYIYKGGSQLEISERISLQLKDRHRVMTFNTDRY